MLRDSASGFIFHISIAVGDFNIILSDFLGLINRSLCWFGVSQNEEHAVLAIALLRYWNFPFYSVLNMPATGPCEVLKRFLASGLFMLFMSLADCSSSSLGSMAIS